MSIETEKFNEKPESYEDLDGLSQDELKEKAVDEFNIDESRLKEEEEKEAMFSKDTADAIANLEYFAEKFENTLRGKVLVKKGNNEEYYIQKNKALVGESFINQVTSIIKTFGNKAMLLSGKGDKEFYIQFEDAYFTVSDMVIERKHNIDVISIRGILKEVKDTFWNIGNILMKTGKNMDVYFGNLGRYNNDYDKKVDDIVGAK